MIDAFKIRYLSYFLYEIWVSIIPVSLFFCCLLLLCVGSHINFMTAASNGVMYSFLYPSVQFIQRRLEKFLDERPMIRRKEYTQLTGLLKNKALNKYSDILFSIASWTPSMSAGVKLEAWAISFTICWKSMVPFDTMRGYNGCSSSSSFEDGFLRKSNFAYMSFLLWVNVAKTPFKRHFNDCLAVR